MDGLHTDFIKDLSKRAKEIINHLGFEEHIVKLSEYLTALILRAITGKIDLRKEVIWCLCRALRQSTALSMWTTSTYVSGALV
ncbi:MAG: hypothetical protein KAT11_00665 [Phycisphaerae bacterium]|nr:hypothetical protein [Phycisphaerae bacterium]